MSMKILLNDGMHKDGIRILNENGFDTDTEKKKEEELLKVIGEYDAISVRSATKVTGDLIKKGIEGKLGVIGRAGVGYDNIDTATADEYGIPVLIAPNGNTNATAELAVALMFAVSRNIPRAHKGLVDGTWYKKPNQGVELRGKTLGVIGLGRIGYRVSQIGRNLGMNVIAYDIFEDPNKDVPFVSLDKLLKTSDYITIHSSSKQAIIGKDELGTMKTSAYLINVARGKLVDEQTLRHALENSIIKGAALDVFLKEGKEGKEFENPYHGLDNVVLTPHLGASTDTAQSLTSIEMADALVKYLKTGEATNLVNLKGSGEKKKTYTLWVTNDNVVGALAAITGVIAEQGYNIVDNKNFSFAGDKAKTMFQLDAPPSGKLYQALIDLPMVHRAN